MTPWERHLLELSTKGGTTAPRSTSPTFSGGLRPDLNFSVAQPGPMDMVLGEIEKCLEAGLIYAAIHLALSVPDVCSALETGSDDDARYRIEKRYTAWCEKYLSPKFYSFNAADCWALRGGVLHNAMPSAHAKLAYDQILFTQPNPNFRIGELISKNNGGTQLTAICLDAGWFCEKMIAAAHEWLAEKGEDPIVAANLPNLVRLRPEGVAPHIVGHPVIA